MSVDNKNVIDIVSIDKEGNANLTISDHLEWDKERISGYTVLSKVFRLNYMPAI